MFQIPRSIYTHIEADNNLKTTVNVRDETVINLEPFGKR